MNLLYIFSLSLDVGPRRLSRLYDIYFLYHYHIIGLRLTCIDIVIYNNLILHSDISWKEHTRSLYHHGQSR